MPVLMHIPYSPWSEKARWVIDARGVQVQRRVYLPMIGEPALRASAKRWRGKITIPVLLREGQPALTDSFEIARWADEQGTTGQPLFPMAHRQALVDWNARSEAMLAAGRAMTTRSVAGDPQAILESLPGPMAKLGPVSGLLGKSGVHFLKTKYDLGATPDAEALATLRDGCRALSEALDAGGGHILGAWSYADITMAVALQFVEPVDDRYIRLGRHSRPHWRRAELAEEFADLIQWRDRLYDERRKSR